MKKHSQFMDPSTDIILNNIDQDVHDTMSVKQLIAVRNAIQYTTQAKGHFINIRSVIPLILIRLYLVILIGVDQRSSGRYRTGFSHILKNSIATLFILFCMGSFLLLSFYIIFYIPITQW